MREEPVRCGHWSACANHKPPFSTPCFSLVCTTQLIIFSFPGTFTYTIIVINVSAILVVLMALKQQTLWPLVSHAHNEVWRNINFLPILSVHIYSKGIQRMVEVLGSDKEARKCYFSLRFLHLLYFILTSKVKDSRLWLPFYIIP